VRLRRALTVWVCAAALVLPTACGASGESGAAAPQSPREDSKKCLARQADHVYTVAARVQKLTQVVLSHPGRKQGSDVEPLRGVLSKVVSRTERFCPGGPVALAPLVALAKSGSESGVDEPGLRTIVDELHAWGRAVGQPRDARILYVANPCESLRDSLDVSFAVRERPESEGKTVRVELHVVNDFPRLVYLDHGGRITATRVRPTGATKTYDWGGSSGDTAGAPPGRTHTEPVYPSRLRTPDVHLFSDGEAHVFQTYASAYGVGFGPCGIKVRRAAD